VDRVVAGVCDYAGCRPPKDDLTCVAVKIQDLDRSIGSRRAALEIASDLTQLPRVQAFLRGSCEQGLDLATVARDLADVQYAVAAVLATIVRHSYCGQVGKPIRIEASLFVNRLSVRIYHRGEPFDFDTAAPPRKKGDTDVSLPSARDRVDEAKCSRSTHGEHCIFLQKWLKQ
jgi:anti-sigma regulatory factor (Ser/Thr protein kinase)